MNSLEETIENAFNTTNISANKTEAINILRKKYGKLDIEVIREKLMPFVAKIYNVPLSRSQTPRNFGALSLDKTHLRYEAARKTLQRLVLKIKS